MSLQHHLVQRGNRKQYRGVCTELHFRGLLAFPDNHEHQHNLDKTSGEEHETWLTLPYNASPTFKSLIHTLILMSVYSCKYICIIPCYI